MVRAPHRPAVMALVAAFLVTILPGVSSQTAEAVSPDIVISQVYGGGGNSGATYTNDFVELFNRGDTTVSVTGWSVQYASAAGTGNFSATPITGSIAAGQYYLVQLAGGATGSALPTPDATGTSNMSATAGKVIVANTATSLACNGGSTACSAGQLAQIVDLVGFGTTATFFEGTGPTPTLANATAAHRANGGCTDTDDNEDDFSVSAPTPRNGASPLAPCGGPDAAPAVTSTMPADDATNVAVNADVSVTFSEPVDVTGSWFSIDCTSSGNHTAAVTGGPTTFTLNPGTDFTEDEDCTVTIVAALVSDQDADDPPDTMVADHEFTFSTVAPIETADINISQVYGGGGNSGATYKNDFIELYNPTASDASLAGWSVQYASSAGSSWQVTPIGVAPLTVSIPAGKHYLIQEAAGTGGTVDLPDPDAIGTIAMAAGSGKVALVASTTPLTGTCPTRADIVDFVGYGTANCSETAPTAALSNTTAALRNGDGAIDTDNNLSDFTIGEPNPRASKDSAPRIASSFPSTGATGVPVWANVTVTFSEPVDVTGAWYSLACATSGVHAATVSGGPTGYTIDPTGTFTGGETCSLVISAAAVTDVDTDDPPDTMAADVTVTFTVATDSACGGAATLISAVQGSGTTSPLAGQEVEIEGVVVGAYPGTTGFQGFHVQEEDADQDGNAATSEGIFIFEPNGGATYAVGDVVRVRGTVLEFNSSGQTLTELTNLRNLVVCSSGASVTPTKVTLPFASPTFAERYESMLVELDQELTVTETFGLGRFGEVVLSSGGRLMTPTNVVEPGAQAAALQAANNLRRIVLDDGDNRQNLDPTLYPTGGLSASNTLRVGDTTDGGTFVLEQRFGVYRLQPTAELPVWEQSNPRTAAPAEVGGSLQVASFNVLNYFDTLDLGPDICGPAEDQECRGADSGLELERQRAKIVAALAGLDADIVGLVEIENDSGGAAADLLAALNAVVGAGTYAALDTGTIGTDAIKVAIIYKPGVVTPIGDEAILDSTVDPRFDDTLNRPALAHTFETVDGGRFTLVVNHLKSKGSACAGDPDTGDGQGNCNVTRTLAAEALVDWLASDPTSSGDRDVLVIGDLNAYANEDPIDVFIDAGYQDLAKAFGGESAYSYVFEGQSGYLDHALASPTLVAQVTGAVDWHVNADEPPVLDYNVEFKSPRHVGTLYEPTPYRSSDHDPVLVGLDLLHFGFEGFLPPLAGSGTTTANAGSALPIRFRLTETSGLDVLFASPMSWQVDCGSGEALGSPSTTTATAGLTQDGGGTYTYDWKTLKAWSRTCRIVELTFDDGAYRQASIHFVK